MVNFILGIMQKYQFLILDFFLGMGLGRIRLYNNQTVFIEDHLDRLFESAKGISLDIPFQKHK